MNKESFLKKQNQTPLADALIQEVEKGRIPFDVPGHKGNVPELVSYFGDRCVALDKNSRKSLDNITHPKTAILEAEQLAAEAFGASKAFFMVGGTTSSVQSMVLSACAPGDKIILPRNVHASVINAVILAGAIPVYVNPSVHPKLGISLGMKYEDVERSILYNTDARAVFVNNPTYYGICSDLERIVKLAHENRMLVLVDEAHGTHFYFGEGLPVSAMASGADMSAVSMHKTGGSLTQSSLLLVGENVDSDRVRNVINLTMTTSASYLLLSSLDIARKKLATAGKELLKKVTAEVELARKQINGLGGYYAFSEEIVDGDSVFAFDRTKLCINTSGLGLAGIELYSLLRDKYGIQLEFGDISNALAVASIGDEKEHFNKLVTALKDIREKYSKEQPNKLAYEYITPLVKTSPQKAFYAKKRVVSIEESIGEISGEFVMCYPPGIPLLAPGELITQEIVEHILYSDEMGCQIIGGSGKDVKEIAVVV